MPSYKTIYMPSDETIAVPSEETISVPTVCPDPINFISQN
jgi:hypothetical protein